MLLGFTLAGGWKLGRPEDWSHLLPLEEDMSRRLSESCLWWCTAAAAPDLCLPFIANSSLLLARIGAPNGYFNCSPSSPSIYLSISEPFLSLSLSPHKVKFKLKRREALVAVSLSLSLSLSLFETLP